MENIGTQITLTELMNADKYKCAYPQAGLQIRESDIDAKFVFISKTCVIHVPTPRHVPAQHSRCMKYEPPNFSDLHRHKFKRYHTYYKQFNVSPTIYLFTFEYQQNIKASSHLAELLTLNS